jgi:hypothetical protein
VFAFYASNVLAHQNLGDSMLLDSFLGMDYLEKHTHIMSSLTRGADIVNYRDSSRVGDRWLFYDDDSAS